jgi:hypothetical protein
MSIGLLAKREARDKDKKKKKKKGVFSATKMVFSTHQ